MGNHIKDDLLARLSEHLVTHLGLYFPPERWSYLEQGIRSAAQDFGFEDLEIFAEWVISTSLTQQQVGMLASRFTIGETYFFREKKSFDILKERILPEIIQARAGKDQRLRIWSAGCSTGEEPYSLAILLSQVLPDPAKWQITILATDINPTSLTQASKGLYREWSFRGNPAGFKEKYFIKKQEGYYELLPAYRKMVNFLYLNLAEDVYPSFLNNTERLDIIFCRNVLMYFAADQKRQVIKRFHRSLADQGWFLASSTDMTASDAALFVPVNFPEAIFYRKRTAQEPVSFAKANGDVGGDIDLRVDILGKNWEKSKAAPAEELPAEQTVYEQVLELFQKFQYADVIQIVLDALTEESRTDECRMLALLAQSYANLGDLLDARAWGEKAVECNKLEPGPHYLLATIFYEQGLFTEAIAALNKALYLDQDFVMAHFALGNIKRQQGKFGEAEKHLENALLALDNYQEEDALPEAEGLTAGRLRESIVGGRRELYGSRK